MKRKFIHPEPTADDLTGPEYWRSLDELTETPGFRDWVEREFPAGASELDGVDRRQFMKIMAASFGLAGVGMAGCRQPTQYILPYAKQPENIIPGIPTFFASSYPTPDENIPLIVETHEARPTKIEGNPSYVPYGGATDIYAQASVLDLYDPDRLQRSRGPGAARLTPAQVHDQLASVANEASANEGEGLVVLAGVSTSPTRVRLVETFQKKYPKAIWAEYEPVSSAGPSKALETVLGKPVRPVYQLAQAKRILSLEADFLHAEPGHLAYARDYAKARKVKSADEAATMNRLYVVESSFSITGANADHRLRAASSHIPAITALILAEALRQSGGASDVIAALETQAKGLEINPVWVQACVADLLENRGRSLVLAGADQPAVVHTLVYALNQLLEADGKTLRYVEIPASSAATIDEAAAAIAKGGVKTLVILQGNPVYNAPANLDWAALQKKVADAGQVIRYGLYDDETAALATTVVAANHYLETWSDGRTWTGSYVPVQPMILPLYQGHPENELIARLNGEAAPDPYALVLETFKATREGDVSEKAFAQWLTQGVCTACDYPAVNAPTAMPGLKTLLAGATLTPSKVNASSLEVRILTSSHAGDGRFNNNGWMQECPDPITKLTWDNAIHVSPRLAKELDILPDPMMMNRLGQLNIADANFVNGQEVAPMARLTVDGTTIEGPVHIQPGLANYTVVCTLGYGRWKTGRIGTRIHARDGEGIGYNAYPLVRSDSPARLTGATLTLTGATYRLANVQQHWSMEGRAIIREANNTDYAENPDFVNQMGMESHSPPIYGPDKNMPLEQKVTEIPRGGSAYKTPAFVGTQGWSPQQWGMSIDLNTCIGCNACVVACQSENNIPIVGRDQVLRGREMHWIRLDRYYSSASGDSMALPEDPQVSFQGMMCQHCELAPCESVCPVNATVHDEQGLNVMAYNRCVGTRYCANNCPYKVRRFNFFDYNERQIGRFYEGPLGPKGMPETLQMQKNPNVTVRMRGVMEKCTFCVQRIESAKINQKVKARDSGNIEVPDGTIKTACQQVCPTDAIQFGDVSDPQSAVYQEKMSDRNYAVLGYLNVRPRLTYLAKLRNPNKAMPDYRDMPLSRLEYKAKSHGSDKKHAEPAHTDA